MFAWDLIFYYSIIFLFLTQVKGITVSRVLLADSYYMLFKCVFQVILAAVINKLNQRKLLVIGNIVLSFGIFALMILQNFNQLIIAYLLISTAFVIKGSIESNLFYDSLPKNRVRGRLFTKLDGIGSSRILHIRCFYCFCCGIFICF